MNHTSTPRKGSRFVLEIKGNERRKEKPDPDPLKGYAPFKNSIVLPDYYLKLNVIKVENVENKDIKKEIKIALTPRR